VAAASYPDFFNDVFGPVMQPGSSSHTAAPCRLGKLAAELLGEPVAAAQILLDKHGSYAGTFGIMAEDRAMVAGVLGLSPDDQRLFHSFELAEQAGIEVSFVFNALTESDHPNAMKFTLTGKSGLTVALVGNSTGGGMVETVTVDGFPWRSIGDTYTLLLFDPEEVAGEEQLAEVAAELPERVESARVCVTDRGCLHVFELSVMPDMTAVNAALQRALPGLRTVVLQPVLPVVTQTDRKPQLFDTMTRWREIAAQRGLALWEVALQYEMDASGWPQAWIVDRMRLLAGLMHHQTRAAYEPGVAIPTSPNKPDFATRWARHAASPRRLTDDLVAQTVKWAYGAGAGIPGVQTVPGPMGSGGGYVYAAMSAVKEARGLTDDDLLRGLFVAGGVGVIAFTITEPTGEVIGCTGEAGVCGAMAAAGIAAMVGAAPEHVEDAASLALQAFTGMPCDPMPGGLCMPCRARVLAATCMAHVFADLAQAGHQAVLPLHEALEVADSIGRGLPPELLCTAEGGACAAPAAQRYRSEYRRWFEQSRPEDRPPGNLI
jgi:L-serine dehydratase